MMDMLVVFSGEFAADSPLSSYSLGDCAGKRNVFGTGAELVMSRPIDETLIGLSSLLEVDFAPPCTK